MPEPDSCPPGSVGLLLSRVGHSVAHGLAARLAPFGLELRQYLLLRAIGACRDQSQQAVASALQIPPSRMVVLVDGLEARGLVERVANPADRRVHALRLTPAGRRLLARAAPQAEAYDAEVCEPLDDDERTTLVQLLNRIAAARELKAAAGREARRAGRRSGHG